MILQNYTSEERIKMAAWLRQLAKDMTEGDPVAAGKLITAAKMIERQLAPKAPH